MSVSLALLGIAGWNAAHEPGPILKPGPLGESAAILPPFKSGSGMIGERSAVARDINSSNAKPASLPQVAFREEK